MRAERVTCELGRWLKALRAPGLLLLALACSTSALEGCAGPGLEPPDGDRSNDGSGGSTADAATPEGGTGALGGSGGVAGAAGGAGGMGGSGGAVATGGSGGSAGMDSDLDGGTDADIDDDAGELSP